MFTFQSIRIVEKEQQYKEVRTQVESMRVTYEKHQRELNERLERTVQEKSSMQDLTRALDEERRRVDELQIGECYSMILNFYSILLGLGEVESERDQLLGMKEKMDKNHRIITEMEEREVLLLKDIEDTKAKHAFAQAEFETERDELNDLVTKSRLLLQVCILIILFDQTKI